ncbi:MAG: hypothetical protein NTZ73_00780 [Candidatus Diapherotrites archaeon]|nr:hypothetical protein [Candidatus Diapherotrites archaeon]
MKAVIDTGTMITLSSTCLMNVFREFIKANKIELLISKKVADESVWKPLENRRFELNAARIKKTMNEGIIKVMPMTAELENETNKIIKLANNIFNSKSESITILQYGESEALAIARLHGAKAVFVDERTTRSLIENPSRLKQVLERRQNRKISVNYSNLEAFRKMFDGIKMFRSVDIIALAYEQGLFDGELEHGKLELEAALYATKYAGCAVSEREIIEYIKK